MKNILLVVYFSFCGCCVLQAFGEVGGRGDIEQIILTCRHKGSPSLSDDLCAYAKTKGMSSSEMATLLVEIAQTTIGETDSPRQRQLADGALWGLIPFGGEREYAFVRQIMQNSSDGGLRLTAISVGMRLKPDNWEQWVEETCNDSRFSRHERFIVCEEAYRIGQNGDEQTKQCVQQVFSRLAERDENLVPKNHLQRWTEDLNSVGASTR